MATPFDPVVAAVAAKALIEARQAIERAKSAETRAMMPGPRGFAGKDGEDGKDGASGKDGKDGKDGRDGIDGKDGERGEAGPAGKDGKDGKPGKDGEKGDTPDHEWIGTGLRFEKPDGTWGETVDLRGQKGASGGRGGGGGSSIPAPFDLAALPLASNDLPTEFVIKQGDSWVRATYEQMRAWFPSGALPEATMTVNGEPVTVNGAFVTVT